MDAWIALHTPEKIGENDSGSTFQTHARASEKQLIAYRKAGSVSGNHYHSGSSPGKNPERLLLVSGKAEIQARNLEGTREETLLAEAPVLVVIPANIHHTVTALTDIAFVEYNSLEEHQQDTYRLES